MSFDSQETESNYGGGKNWRYRICVEKYRESTEEGAVTIALSKVMCHMLKSTPNSTRQTEVTEIREHEKRSKAYSYFTLRTRRLSRPLNHKSSGPFRSFRCI